MTDLSVAELLNKSKNLIASFSSRGTPKFLNRKSIGYHGICTGRETHGDYLAPIVHLWQPTVDEFNQVVVDYNLKPTEESPLVAIHGHEYWEMCGLKERRSQLCHMAFFKPTGVETDSFNKKWNYLYANETGEIESPVHQHRDSSGDRPRFGGIELGRMG